MQHSYSGTEQFSWNLQEMFPLGTPVLSHWYVPEVCTGNVQYRSKCQGTFKLSSKSHFNETFKANTAQSGIKSKIDGTDDYSENKYEYI